MVDGSSCQTGAMAVVTTDELVARARQLGASAVGVCGVEPFHEAHRTLRASITDGRSGPLRFTYDDPEIATDIRATFEWARSVVVVAHGYAAASNPPPDVGGVIARFATSNQYLPLNETLEALGRHLRSAGHRAEAIVDDNRLVDRAVAARAGVGWLGKSTMLLNPAQGPWMLVGSVVTDAHLSSTEPMIRTCGTCTACIPACPTSALDANGLDARRCLATWLQSPGAIPHWIRPLLGRRIYGCDDCLVACPPGFAALDGSNGVPEVVDFVEMLAMTDHELVNRFEWWYIPRRQGRYLRRNLLIAAGNSGEPDAWDSITNHLEHPSALIRGVAAWATARADPDLARPILATRLHEESVQQARDELRLATLMVDQPEVYRTVLEADERARGTTHIKAHGLVWPSHCEPRLWALCEGDAPPRRLGLEVVDMAVVDVARDEVVVLHDPDRRLERAVRPR